MSKSALFSLGALTGLAVAAGYRSLSSTRESNSDTRSHSKKKRSGVIAAIGNTPLIELKTLSKKTGCRILAKCEFLNPGGSVKDRAALWMIEEAEERGFLDPEKGGTIYEGTGGNTGVALSMIAAAKGYKATMALPKSIAREKKDAMRTFGATVIETPAVGFDSQQHYYHEARIRAENDTGPSFWANQFDNLANMRSHFEGTAPEIWQQAKSQFGLTVDGFVCSAGTGGTLSGCAKFFKEVNSSIQCFLIDPPGSALYDYIHNKSKPEDISAQDILGRKTRFIKRSKGDSIAEGIGIGRLTGNFTENQNLIDGSFQGDDKLALKMAYYLKETEGVYVGPSAALNVAGAVMLAEKMGPGHTIVTILCDGGARYSSKIYNREWLEEKGLADVLEI